MIGNKLDSSFSRQNVESCVSCTDIKDTIDSRCTCDLNSAVIGGECRETIIVYELKSDSDDLSYFIPCRNSGVIKVAANLTITAATNIALFKDDNCIPSNI